MTVATKICKDYEYPNVVCYTASCACSSPDHQQTLSVIFDDEHKELRIEIMSEIEVCNWAFYHRNPNAWTAFTDHLKNFAWRVRNALKILATGRITGTNEFCIMGTEQCVSYANAIYDASIKMKEGKNV